VRATEQSFHDNSKVCSLVDCLWNNQYDPESDTGVHGSDNGDNEGESDERQGQGQGRNIKTAKLGPREVLPLKELLVALQEEINACMSKKQLVEEVLRENSAALAASLAASRAAAEEALAASDVENTRPAPSSESYGECKTSNHRSGWA
jgi:hypothetical protein